MSTTNTWSDYSTLIYFYPFWFITYLTYDYFFNKYLFLFTSTWFAFLLNILTINVLNANFEEAWFWNFSLANVCYVLRMHWFYLIRNITEILKAWLIIINRLTFSFNILGAKICQIELYQMMLKMTIHIRLQMHFMILWTIILFSKLSKYLNLTIDI